MRHAQLSPRAQQVQIVDPLDLRVVGIDDLAVEDVLRQRDLVGEEVERLQRLDALAQARSRIVAGGDVYPIEAADVAAADADAERGDARVRGVAGVGEEVDDGADTLSVVEQRRPPEQVGEEDERAFARGLAVPWRD
ncbi:MAG TPA: hypothetical protein VE755_03655 [Myxococcales bacterium]|nr:hypothetical protein [Myxococcales bacterium]